MRMVNHPNIVTLKDSFYETQDDEVFLNLVLDYVPKNLYEVSSVYVRQKRQMPLIFIKVLNFPQHSELSVFLFCLKETTRPNLSNEVNFFKFGWFVFHSLLIHFSFVSVVYISVVSRVGLHSLSGNLSSWHQTSKSSHRSWNSRLETLWLWQCQNPRQSTLSFFTLRICTF